MSGNGNIWKETILIASRASFGGGRMFKSQKHFCCLPSDQIARRVHFYLGANCIFVVKFFLWRRIFHSNPLEDDFEISTTTCDLSTYPIHLYSASSSFLGSLFAVFRFLGIFFLHPLSLPYLRRFLRNCNQGPFVWRSGLRAALGCQGVWRASSI